VRRLALVLAALAGVAALPAGAAAVIPGPNGPLIFTSGRDDGATVLSDGRAQIWYLSGPGGTAQRVTTLELSHHRHASWSPDRTKIAYARGPDDGTPFDGPWDIFVQDLSIPGSAPVNITSSPMNEDRPTWSPDGTRLAYAKQVAATTWDVVTKSATGAGAETLVGAAASTGMGASGQFSRPQWSPDGQFIYYGRIVGANDYDIYRAPSAGAMVPVGDPVITGPANDYQAALSPDGTTLCFTRDSTADKDVYVAPASGGTGVPLVATPAPNIDYECAWSPDGTKIAFVRGAFGAGEILMRDSDPAGAPGIDLVTNVNTRFDGNPEWTYNPPPSCENRTVQVPFNGFVSIPLTCTDPPDPPTFAPKELLTPTIGTPPASGNLGQVQGDNSVIYTPNANFTGTDTFTYSSNDGTSPAPTATVTINVAGPPPPDGPIPDTTRPVISNLALSRKRFRRGNRLPVASQTRVGTTISFRLSEAGRATFSFQRARPGRRVGRRCARPTPRNRTRRPCKRFVRAGSFRFAAKAGANRVRFQGRLTRSRRLAQGSYRVIVSARDAAGNTSARNPRASFTVVRR
jgi:Tol biopolymer transport system component